MSLKLTWYGHAALGLETGGLHILVDPYFTDNPASTTSADKVSADFILVSHGHGDHLGDTAAISERTGALAISTGEVARWLNTHHKTKTAAMQIGGGRKYPFGYLKLTPAVHSSTMPDGVYGGNPAGFLLTTTEGLKVYIAGDTGLFGDMRLIGEEGIDLAVLPIGDNYTMGPDDALRAVKMLQPRHVIPIHYSTWEMIAQDAGAWCTRVEAETPAKAHWIKPGESFVLTPA